MKVVSTSSGFSDFDIAADRSAHQFRRRADLCKA
jgi:hypothetical protein